MSDAFFSATYPKARRPHACAMCQRRIEPGETYRRQGYVYDGRRDATKLCTQCYTFAGILSTLGFEDDEGHWPWLGEVDQSEVAHCGYGVEMGHFRRGWRLSDDSLFIFPESGEVRPSVEVACGNCGGSLGDQFAPGDGLLLAVAHRATCPNQTHPTNEGASS